MIEGLLLGIHTALSLKNMLMIFGGCIVGTFIGMLPGLGPMSIIAIMIPVAISLGDPAAALILLAGVYYGAIFGGSTSSILINAPGVASTVATSFDGYPLTRQGKAGKALTIAAISSFAGGTLGAILLLFFAPTLATVAKSTCPESGDMTTLAPKAVHAAPGAHEPHDEGEQSRMSALKRSTNWNCVTFFCEYSWIGMQTWSPLGSTISPCVLPMS